MTWIRVDHEAPADDKMAQLADSLGIPTAYAFGLVAAVWCGVSIHAPDGMIRDVSNRSLETWALWEGKRGRFAHYFRVLFEREDGSLSGWRERQGKLIERMEKDRQRHRGKSAEPPRKFLGASAEIPALRNDNDTVRTDVVVGSAEEIEAPTERQPIAILLTSAANQGITAKYGEQPNPLIWSSPGAMEVTDAVLTKGIPVMFARDAMYSAAQVCSLVRPPTSIKYFLRQIVNAWEQEVARRDAAASPTPKIISFDKRVSELADTKAKLRAGLPI